MNPAATLRFKQLAADYCCLDTPASCNHYVKIESEAV